MTIIEWKEDRSHEISHCRSGRRGHRHRRASIKKRGRSGAANTGQTNQNLIKRDKALQKTDEKNALF